MPPPYRHIVRHRFEAYNLHSHPNQTQAKWSVTFVFISSSLRFAFSSFCFLSSVKFISRYLLSCLVHFDCFILSMYLHGISVFHYKLYVECRHTHAHISRLIYAGNKPTSWPVGTMIVLSHLALSSEVGCGPLICNVSETHTYKLPIRSRFPGNLLDCN